MSDLKQLREEITQITEEMMQLFERRQEVSVAIARYKKEQGLPIYQPQREQELMEHYGKDELSKLFIETLLHCSKERQKEELKK